MTLDEARGHEGETLVHRFLGKDPERAEFVRVGDYALHICLGGWSEEDAAPDDAERVVVLGPVN